MDNRYLNELEIRYGRVTGEVVGEIVDGKRNAMLLQEITAKENLDLDQMIAWAMVTTSNTQDRRA